MKVDPIVKMSKDKQQKEPVPNNNAKRRVEQRELILAKAKGECTKEDWPPSGALIKLTKAELDDLLESAYVFNNYNTISIQLSRGDYWVRLGSRAETDLPYARQEYATGGLVTPNIALTCSPNNASCSPMYDAARSYVNFTPLTGTQMDTIASSLTEAIKARIEGKVNNE